LRIKALRAAPHKFGTIILGYNSLTLLSQGVLPKGRLLIPYLCGAVLRNCYLLFRFIHNLLTHWQSAMAKGNFARQIDNIGHLLKPKPRKVTLGILWGYSGARSKWDEMPQSKQNRRITFLTISKKEQKYKHIGAVSECQQRRGNVDGTSMERRWNVLPI